MLKTYSRSIKINQPDAARIQIEILSKLSDTENPPEFTLTNNLIHAEMHHYIRYC